MKTCLITLFLLPLTALTQSADSSRWAVSSELALGSSFQGDEHTETYGYFSWLAGAKISRMAPNKRGKMIGFSTGLYYSNRAQRIENRTFSSNLNLATGEFDTIFSVIDERELLELPFLFGTGIDWMDWKKWRCYGEYGFGAVAILNERQRWTATPVGGKGIPDYRTTNNKLFAVGGKLAMHAGFGYPLAEKTELIFTLNMDFYWLPAGHKMLTAQSLYTMEGGVSLRRSF